MSATSGKKRGRKSLEELSEPEESDSDTRQQTSKNKANAKSKSKSKTKSPVKSPSKSKPKSNSNSNSKSNSGSKGKSKRKSKYTSDSSDSEEDDDDIAISQLKSKGKSKNSTKTGTKTKEKSKENESSGTSSPPRKKSRRLAVQAKKEEDEFASDFDYQIEQNETVFLLYPKNYKPSSKIAAFDMDSTLVCPKGKQKFPRNRNDWQWVWASVPSKLKSLHNDGFRIVIFTNQAGIAGGKQYASDIYGKIIDISNQLGIPITGMISSTKDYWRKPNTFMWDYFVKHLNGSSSSDATKSKDKSNDKSNDNKDDDCKIDFDKSFYCGDAAGRPAGWNGDKKCKRDFSVSDRKFAANIGLKFMTPEPLFLKHKECNKFEWRSLDAKEYLSKYPESNYDKIESWFHGTLPIAKKDKLDMVIMVGPPGAGKSTIATKYLQKEGYIWVNRDTLGTQAKCQKLAETALKQGNNVVIDNTNPDSIARQPYIKLGKKYKANIRVFFMNIEKELAEHMNLYREKMTDGDRKRVPGMVFNMFYKKVREDGKPDKSEGIDEVVTIDLIPHFKDEQHRKWFLEWN